VLPEALIETFMEMGYIDKLADFVARYGDAFYGRPTLDRKLRFERQDWVVPHRVGGVNEFEPYLADCKLSWRQVA
jgi:dihydroorotase